MSTSGRNGSGRPIVLVFGESLNDSMSVKSLLVHVNRALDRRVKARPSPVSLTRTASPPKIRDWVGEIRRTIAAEEAAGQSVCAALVHRDADGPDPTARVEYDLALQIQRLQKGYPVVPVQMIETWWFLFPDAIEAVRPRAWKGKLPRRARNVEKIDSPKAELQRLTGKGNTPEYAEADSRAIAENVRHLSLTPLGTSASYQRFVALARAIQ